MSALLIRTLSAVVLGPLVILAVYFGGLYFQVLVSVILIIGISEWFKMCHLKQNDGSTFKTLWFIIGALYIAASCLGLYWLRLKTENGDMSIYWLFAVVWSADTGAYLVGSTLGGPKLAPKISPKKTWSGLIGALSSAAIAGGTCAYLTENTDTLICLLVLSVAVAFVSQLGDLLESYAKRKFNVKDSGTIIPGHGGVLDRMDGLFAAALMSALLGYFYSTTLLPWM